MSKRFKLVRIDKVESVGATLTEKDMEYLAKLIYNDINYRTKRAAGRVYLGNGDVTAIAKANRLKDELTLVLNWEEEN